MNMTEFMPREHEYRKMFQNLYGGRKFCRETSQLLSGPDFLRCLTKVSEIITSETSQMSGSASEFYAQRSKKISDTGLMQESWIKNFLDRLRDDSSEAGFRQVMLIIVVFAAATIPLTFILIGLAHIL